MRGNLGRLVDHLRAENARSFLQDRRDHHLAHYPQLCCYSFELLGNDVAVAGRYDKEAVELLVDWLGTRVPVGAVLDIGANVGNHAAAFAETGRRVWCFEPHPKTFKLLELNMADYANATCLRLGASDRAGAVRAVTRHRNFGATTITDRAPLAGESVWNFEVVRLDDVAALAAERIAFIKIDVEDHEPQALAGAQRLIARDRPLIALEQNYSEIADGTSASVELLRGWGYVHFASIETGLGWKTALPWPLRGAGRAIETLVSGFPDRVARVEPVDRLEPRYYGTLVASTELIG